MQVIGSVLRLILEPRAIVFGLVLTAVLAAPEADVPRLPCPVEAAAAEGRTLERPEGANLELFSWREPDGSFHYSLMWGTSETRTLADIRAPSCRVSSLLELLEVLRVAAQGECVRWANERYPAELTYPDSYEVSTLWHLARDERICLEIAPSVAGGPQDKSITEPRIIG